MARSLSPSVATSGAWTVAVPGRSLVLNLFWSVRPGQWTKNLLGFAGLLSGRRLLDPAAIIEAVAAFAVFCGLSGAVYLIQDIADRETDRRHPLKTRRPIASGALSVRAASLAAATLLATSLAGAAALGRWFGA